jgi:flagellar hook-length control protein FliK
MSIQQVASGNSSGIMSFLFQEDGSADGTVLEGAEFAKTLHQLLGEYEGGESETAEAARPATAVSEEVATEANLKESTAKLTQGLEGLLKDFKLPEHSAKLPPEASLEGEADGQEVEQPFWGIAPFTDVMAALREHTTALHSTAAEIDATAANDTAAAMEITDATALATPPAPAFQSGIAHVIEMARDAAQVSAELTQQHAPALPTAPLQSNAGRNAPLNGKILPQGFRSTSAALNLNQAATSANAKASQTTSGDAALPMPGGEATVSNSFFADLMNVKAETTSPQATAPQAQTLTQGIHGLHTQSPAANLPRAASTDTAATNPMPQFQSEHLAGSDAWFQDLGARVDWLKDMKVDKAELQLHPAELGLLEIHISAGDDGTTVSFVTHNAEARHLIEDSMPRLRELLANQGMHLGQSHVSQHSEGQRRGHEAHTGSTGAARDNTQADEPAPIRHRAYVADPNRIDHYV